jgi:hypothetical protein
LPGIGKTAVEFIKTASNTFMMGFTNTGILIIFGICKNCRSSVRNLIVHSVQQTFCKSKNGNDVNVLLAS